MHTKLVGAAGVGDEPNEGGPVVTNFQHFVVGDGRLALFGIDHLPRTVVPVGCQRQRDFATVAGFQRLVARHHPGQIGFRNLPFLKLLLERRLHFRRLGEDHQSGCIHVEPMAGQDRTAAVAGQPVLQRMTRRNAFDRTSRNGQHAGRLLRDDQCGIFVADDRVGQMPVGVALQRIGFHVDALQHIPEQAG